MRRAEYEARIKRQQQFGWVIIFPTLALMFISALLNDFASVKAWPILDIMGLAGIAWLFSTGLWVESKISKPIMEFEEEAIRKALEE
ncbi:MAG: hypothetical protein KGI38_11785 [Thaumarchaeota archaeon]|nr:hypothetical protein [Nitrososphaerota archaeon]